MWAACGRRPPLRPLLRDRRCRPAPPRRRCATSSTALRRRRVRWSRRCRSMWRQARASRSCCAMQRSAGTAAVAPNCSRCWGAAYSRHTTAASLCQPARRRCTSCCSAPCARPPATAQHARLLAASRAPRRRCSAWRSALPQATRQRSAHCARASRSPWRAALRLRLPSRYCERRSRTCLTSPLAALGLASRGAPSAQRCSRVFYAPSSRRAAAWVATPCSPMPPRPRRHPSPPRRQRASQSLSSTARPSSHAPQQAPSVWSVRLRRCPSPRGCRRTRANMRPRAQAQTRLCRRRRPPRSPSAAWCLHCARCSSATRSAKLRWSRSV
mmetsp:Transcript_675/g.2322  ORF Transcript_675/g.2322 Transcript_675/m.2322 type:complete len:327 (-) Transcript_675:1473-2453(-)